MFYTINESISGIFGKGITFAELLGYEDKWLIETITSILGGQEYIIEIQNK